MQECKIMYNCYACTSTNNSTYSVWSFYSSSTEFIFSNFTNISFRIRFYQICQQFIVNNNKFNISFYLLIHNYQVHEYNLCTIMIFNVAIFFFFFFFTNSSSWNFFKKLLFLQSCQKLIIFTKNSKNYYELAKTLKANVFKFIPVPKHQLKSE